MGWRSAPDVKQAALLMLRRSEEGALIHAVLCDELPGFGWLQSVRIGVFGNEYIPAIRIHENVDAEPQESMGDHAAPPCTRASGWASSALTIWSRSCFFGCPELAGVVFGQHFIGIAARVVGIGQQAAERVSQSGYNVGGHGGDFGGGRVGSPVDAASLGKRHRLAVIP